MAEWKRVRLGDMTSLITKGTTPKGEYLSRCHNGAVSFLRAENISNGIVRQDSFKYINESVHRNELRRSVLQEGDILITIAGAIGRIALVTSAFLPANINQAIALVRLQSSEVDKRYLMYYLSNPSLQEELLSISSGQSVQANLNLQQIGDIQVSLPPLATQRKIAAVLGAIDDKIETNRKIGANLEAQAQALFKSWFVDFEPFGGKMPKGWKEQRLPDVASFFGGYSYKGCELVSSDCAMATIKNFNRGGGFKLEGFKEIVPSSKLKPFQIVDLFDVMVAHTDLTQKAEVIGNAEMLLSKCGYERVIMSMDLVKVVPQKGLSKFLLALLLKNPVLKEHCLKYVNGTTVLHLSKSALCEYALYLPKDLSSLGTVSDLAESLYRKEAALIDESRALAAMRDALLPKLMSGEIDVSKVEVA